MSYNGNTFFTVAKPRLLQNICRSSFDLTESCCDAMCGQTDYLSGVSIISCYFRMHTSYVVLATSDVVADNLQVVD